MNNNFWELFWTKLKELYKKEDGNTEAYELEQPILEKVLKKIKEKLEGIYDFIEPIGRGGAGVIIRLKDNRLNFDRALKIPRPKEEKIIDSVRTEIEYLNKIRHENIISIHTLGEVEIQDVPYPYPYFVMDYIEGAQDLRRKTSLFLDNAADSKQLKEIMKWVANKIYTIAEAISFLHRNEIIHFDIKPTNILIDKNDKPILTDLGFAKKKTDDEAEKVIGFTLFYAHPDLRQEYEHMSSKNRVRKKESPSKFKYVWDIYAFGKSLLEILSFIDRKFPDTVFYDYNFVYLHLAACRMLDGRNMSHREVEKIREKQIQDGMDLSVYREEWLELEARDFEEISYKSFENICIDFEKLLKGDRFLDAIPELKSFYHKRVQSSEGIPAPFSDRVKHIVEHPIFSRLEYVPQLGLLKHIYPLRRTID